MLITRLAAGTVSMGTRRFANYNKLHSSDLVTAGTVSMGTRRLANYNKLHSSDLVTFRLSSVLHAFMHPRPVLSLREDSGLTVTRAASAKVTNAISREKPEEWFVRS